MHGKRLTTANGYDSNEQKAKMVHSFKAMQNEHFIDQLREKVDRGMTDAFRRGRNLGALPLGYKRIPKLDSANQPIINHKGKCETDVVIDEEASEVVRSIFRRYADSKMSPIRVARYLNEVQALERNDWRPSTVVATLKNERYIGRFSWKKTRTVSNPRTGKKAAILRPHSERLCQNVPGMRIVSDEL